MPPAANAFPFTAATVGTDRTRKRPRRRMTSTTKRPPSLLPSPAIHVRSRPFEKNFSSPVVTSAAGPLEASTVSSASLSAFTDARLKRFSPARIVSTKTSPSRRRSTSGIWNPLSSACRADVALIWRPFLSWAPSCRTRAAAGAARDAAGLWYRLPACAAGVPMSELRLEAYGPLGDATRHRSGAALEAAFRALPPPPHDQGRLLLIVCR